MGKNNLDVHDELQKRRTALVFDHFESYVDAQLWTKGGDAGTVANSDGDGGILTMTTGAGADQDAFVATTRKNWTFLAGKPMTFQCGFRYSEANTDQACIFAGFCSGAFNTILTDNTYVLLTPCSAAGILKKPGETKWSAFSSVGAVQKLTPSISPCQQAGLIQEFIIEVAIVGLNIEVTFKQGGPGPVSVVGGGPAGPTYMYPDVTTMARMQPIKHVIPFAGALAMAAGVDIKAGSGSSEVLSLDYAAIEHLVMP